MIYAYMTGLRMKAVNTLPNIGRGIVSIMVCMVVGIVVFVFLYGWISLGIYISNEFTYQYLTLYLGYENVFLWFTSLFISLMAVSLIIIVAALIAKHVKSTIETGSP